MPSIGSEIISVLGSTLSQLPEFTDESVISSRSNCSIAWMQRVQKTSRTFSVTKILQLLQLLINMGHLLKML